MVVPSLKHIYKFHAVENQLDIPNVACRPIHIWKTKCEYFQVPKFWGVESNANLITTILQYTKLKICVTVILLIFSPMY